MKRKRHDNYRKTMYAPVECFCPKCEKSFMHAFDWNFTGKGRPRIYCAECRQAISGYDNSANMERRGLPREFGRI